MKHHQATKENADSAMGQMSELRESLADAINRGVEWKEKHDMLKQQIDQYDERQRFDTWFKTRPEAKGSSDSTSLKEKMWESWLERSKVVEVAA
ncbi:hypothetical protein PQR12_31080 [Paraburkholderia nemoris]|uniref:hypothetical protein n=1 Tax=Paraburkholderia nemoris TaxID=2793076 RepID=UPI0038B8C93B